MTETKGLVMKVTDQYIVVMCDDGKFRNIPLPKQVPSVGERITVPLDPQKNKNRQLIYWSSAVAVLFLIFLSSIFGFAFHPKYYQVVAIDINPSLELYLDANNHIIHARPLNKDAEKVLNTFAWKGEPVNEAISEILKKSIDLGYITKEKTNLVMITIAKIREGGVEIQSKSIENLVGRIFQAENINGFLRVEKTDKSSYTDSQEKKISLNKLILIQQAKQLGIQLDPRKVASEPISQFLHDAGLNVEQFFVPIGEEQGTIDNSNSSLENKTSEKKGSLKQTNDKGVQQNQFSGTPAQNPRNKPQSPNSSESPGNHTSGTEYNSNNPVQGSSLERSVPMNSTSQSDSGNNSMTNNNPISSTPTNSTPTNSTPTNSTPTNSTPTNSTPTNSTPTNSTPTNSTPTNSTPTNSTPTNSTPTNSTPTTNESPMNSNSTPSSTSGSW